MRRQWCQLKWQEAAGGLKHGKSHIKKNFYHKANWTLEEAALRGWGASILWDKSRRYTALKILLQLPMLWAKGSSKRSAAAPSNLWDLMILGKLFLIPDFISNGVNALRNSCYTRGSYSQNQVQTWLFGFFFVVMFWFVFLTDCSCTIQFPW